MHTYDKVYINGKWVAPQGQDKAIEVFDSTNEQVMATIPSCNAQDVDAAARAAATAFLTWSALDVEERAKYMNRIGDGIAARMDELATAISRETGMTKFLSQMIQVGLPINSFKQAAIVAEKFEYSHELGSSLVVREPIGVVGCITPWNYPLHQITAKVAFAMAAGCTVVLKPSEIAPIDAFILAEIIDEIGLPAGVFNLVTGTGPVVGEALAAHPSVDMISFTGSTRAGRRVSQVAAETVKKVALELGGKSANIICADLDEATFAKAVSSGVGGAFLNSGQTCLALTRMLVPRSRLAEAETLAGAAATAMVVGDPFEKTTALGPLASAAQRDRVNGYIQKGIDEGAKVVVGGVGVPEGCTTGYYVKPTVFSNVTNSMTIARDEIFGPVLSIIAYDNEEEAIQIANDTVYGLSGAVWAADKDKAIAIARRIRTGQIAVNGGAFNINAPLGGYKQSGIGREYSEYGFEEFLEIKSMQL
ncbi:MAG: aldehyde dehydrogenase family protein [Actinobacteria bacterium]|uniref:aldehyde dehydrogenase (NAD(+)) n=1 Tax=freshwater metagenome TaxID=449393 RepID=A0A6J6HL76_9ZZZZ|nr:aldehyde dehydrogenase family protein [Actinomycetota bacterium]